MLVNNVVDPEGALHLIYAAMCVQDIAIHTQKA